MAITWKEVLERAGYPQTAIILDFETYFTTDYSLKKMSTIEYVCDSRFEFTGLGAQRLGSGAGCCEPNEIKTFINWLTDTYGLQFEGCTIIGQNLKFDCLILARKFGIIPKYTVDTRDLDRVWDARDKHNLEYMAKKWKSPKPKGDTQQFKGLHWADFEMDVFKRQKLIDYTKGDVEIEADIFQKLMPLIPNPEIELPLATQTLHMYLKPQIEIDFELGQKLQHQMRIESAKPRMELRKLGIKASKTAISGNKSFIALLNQELPDDEKVPMKMGKKGMIPALAKDDEGLHYLLHHEKESVRLLAEARVAVKSWPLHIKRVQNLMNQAACSDGRIGAPLSFYAGHLGRWGGTEKINLQNLGGRGRGTAIHPLIGQVRQMLKAPDGFVFGNPDFSQIEARVLAWLAGQQDLVQIFADGGSPYSDLATEVFQQPIRKPKDTDSDDVKKDLAVKYGFGKDAILGCGYGMGTNKFFARCNENENLRPLFESGEYDWDFVDRLIKTYRRKYAKIPEFWRIVEKAWRFVTKYPKERVELDKGLTFWHEDRATFIGLPSGRFIRYPYASVNKQGDLLYRWGQLWGGSLTENCVQAIARDVMAEALLRLEDAGYNILFHAHDEIICLLHKSCADLWLEGAISIMTMQPPWAKGLPLAAEGKLCARYEK